MGDARLRSLERRFRATGSIADETEWLRERLRVGEVTAARVEIAAYLGHEPSLAVLGDEAPDVLTADELPGYRLRLDQVGWDGMGYLAEVGKWWGQEFCLRFSIAAAHHAIEAQQRKRGGGAGARAQIESARATVVGAERWLFDPRFGQRIRPVAEAERSVPGAHNNLSTTADRVYMLSDMTQRQGSRDWREKVMSAYLAEAILAATRIATASVPGQRRERAALLERAREEITPWALGTGDPIRDRVDARK